MLTNLDKPDIQDLHDLNERIFTLLHKVVKELYLGQGDTNQARDHYLDIELTHLWHIDVRYFTSISIEWQNEISKFIAELQDLIEPLLYERIYEQQIAQVDSEYERMIKNYRLMQQFI